jgi:initiation factor 1A
VKNYKIDYILFIISINKMRNKNINVFKTKEKLNETYGRVTKRLGGRPPVLEVLCIDKVIRKCVIRGKFTKKVWINPDDIVLIELEEYEQTGEIVCKYSSSEVKKMIKEGVLPEEWLQKETEEESNIIFDEEQDKRSSEDDDDFIKI